jgi:acyl dehydratase
VTAVREGDQGPAFSIGPLTRTDLVRYAGASGDFNPLHHDELFAREAGLPSVMAHGMLSAGLLGSFLTRWFGAGSVRRFKVRFRERVWPGDVLSAQGKVVGIAGGSATLELSLVRQDGVAVVTGSAEVAL